MEPNFIPTSVNTNYFQGMQDYFQKTIDTSDSSISRAFAAIGQFFTTALNSLAGTQPLEISRYHKEIDEGNTKISTVAFAILTNKSVDEIKGLLQKGAPVNNQEILALYKRPHLKPTIKSLEENLSVNLPQGDLQRTPLMEAKTIDEIMYCIKAGANVNAQDINGRTALSLAFEAANQDAIKTLLEYGANIHLADKSGKTPLMYAVQKSENTPKILFDILNSQKCTGKALDKCDKDGMTAFMYAAQAGNSKTALMLCDKLGADVLLKNHEGKRASDLTPTSKKSDPKSKQKKGENVEIKYAQSHPLRPKITTTIQSNAKKKSALKAP